MNGDACSACRRSRHDKQCECQLWRLVPSSRAKNGEYVNNSGSRLRFHDQQMTLCSIRTSLRGHMGANDHKHIK